METPWRNRKRLPDSAFAYVGEVDDRIIEAYPIISRAHALRSLLGLNQWAQYQEEHCPLFLPMDEVEQIRAKIQAVLDSGEQV